MPCDSVRNLGVRSDNGADGSRCWSEPRELQLVRRKGVDRNPEGPSARLTREIRAVGRASARSSLDAPIVTGVDPVTVGVRVGGSTPPYRAGSGCRTPCGCRRPPPSRRWVRLRSTGPARRRGQGTCRPGRRRGQGLAARVMPGPARATRLPLEAAGYPGWRCCIALAQGTLRPQPPRCIKWPRPTRRTRRPTAGSPAPQRPARNGPVDRSVRKHARR